MPSGFDSENLVDRLNQLHRSVNEQRQFVNARKEHANKYKSLRSRLNKAKRELDKLLGQKQRLLAAVGAESEADYRALDATFARRRKLQKKRDSITEQISAARGKHYEEKQLAQLLDSYGAAGLEKQVKEEKRRKSKDDNPLWWPLERAIAKCPSKAELETLVGTNLSAFGNTTLFKSH